MTVINNLQDVFDIVVDGIYIIRDTIDDMNLYIGIHKISLWDVVGATLVSAVLTTLINGDMSAEDQMFYQSPYDNDFDD